MSTTKQKRPPKRGAPLPNYPGKTSLARHGSIVIVQLITLLPATAPDVFEPSPLAPVEKSSESSSQFTDVAVPPSAFESTLIVTSVNGLFENDTVVAPLEHVPTACTFTVLVVSPSAW